MDEVGIVLRLDCFGENLYFVVSRKQMTCMVCSSSHCVNILVRDVLSYIMLVGVLYVFVHVFPFTTRASLLTCAQQRHVWRRCTMPSAPPSHAAAAQRAAKNAQQPKLPPLPPEAVNMPLTMMPEDRNQRTNNMVTTI